MKSKITHIIFSVFIFLISSINSASGQGYSLVTPVDMGTFNSNFSISDTRNTGDYDNSFVYGIGSKIVFHKFTITQTMDISLSHSGSELQRTSLKLIKTDQFNVNDVISSCNTGSTQAYLNVRLNPGVYYVASQGSSTNYNGKITLSIQGNLVIENKLIEINLDVKEGDSFYYYNTVNTTNSKSQYGYRPTNDIYYNFRVNSKGTKLKVTTSMDAEGGSCVTLLNGSNNLGYKCVSRNNPNKVSLEFPLLPPGIYSIVVEGGMSNGDIETYIECTDPLELNLGEKEASFEYTDTKTTTQYNKKSIYRIIAKKKMDIAISNTTSFSAGSSINLLDATKKSIATKVFPKNNSLTNTLVVNNLEPGVYYVESNGVSEDGNITTYIDAHFQIVRDLGIISDDLDFFDIQNSAKSRNEWSNKPGNEVIYKMKIISPMTLNISNSSSLSSGTYVSLTNIEKSQLFATKNFVKDNFILLNDYLNIQIQPGEYYVISEGATENGIIPTRINLLKTNSNKNKYINYVKTRGFLNENGTQYMDQIQYFDGLGRPEQIIKKNFSPTNKDIVSIQEYDRFGRDSLYWLAASVPNNDGAYLNPLFVKTMSVTTNGNDQNPYSRSLYEASPLNRVLEQYDPGSAWKTAGASVKTRYLTNVATGDTKLICSLFSVEGTGIATKVKRSGNYAANQLYVIEMKDEQGNLSYEFKDKLGQVVLTRQIENNVNHDTYYVYDDFGNKCFVLPPPTSDNLMQYIGSWDNTNATSVAQYAYIYRYDNRNRCIWKKLPGCEPITCVYDKADRLIFTQDGEQRTRGEWLFSIPDALGRPVLSGICKNTMDYSTNPLKDIMVKGSWAKVTNTNRGYNITGITLTTPTILTVNYYDSYEFMGLNSIPPITDANFKPETITGYGIQYTGGYKNLLTGTWTALLDGSTNGIYSVMYYDYKGQVIQTKSNNHLPGGIEKEYIAYNFTGQLTQKQHVHIATGKTTQTEVYTYVYDHAGRLTATKHKLNTGSEVILAQNTYDELGRLSTTTANNQANLKATYAYNIRSWTKSITNPLFNQTLYYEESYVGSTKQYNGNISAMSWKTINEGTNLLGYAFTYDNLSRLTKATYLGNGAVYSGESYNTSYTYDKMGNMKTLTRSGRTSATVNGPVDNLTMTYTGNQLTKAEDAIPTITLAGSMDFKNYSNVATEYTYNKNGAMTQDLNKGISTIAYNSLNLPQLMDIKSPVAEARNEYTYTATGAKLKVIKKWNPNYSTTPVVGSTINTTLLTQNETTDYVGNKIYENGALKRILTDNGYIEGNIYYFYIKDHLGNNRIVAKSDDTMVQATHYYPFGSSFAVATGASVQPYKYNNKELDTMHGLNWYDYSARQKDDFRFTTMDPHSENYYSWSPYAYCGNNPMKYIDPTGMDWVYRVVDGKHEVYYDRSVRSQDDVNIKYGSDGGVTHLANGATATISNKNGDVTAQYTFFNDASEHNQYGAVVNQNGDLMADNQIISGSSYNIFGTSDNSVNAETLHSNLFGSNYIGPNNPKDYVGNDSYQFMPQSYNDAIAYMHDLGYDSKQAKGVAAALFGANVYPEDRLLTLQARVGMLVGSPRDRFDAGLMYIGFGAISAVKAPINGIQGLAGYSVPFILGSMILFKQQHPLP